jgi:hypothetical protein
MLHFEKQRTGCSEYTTPMAIQITRNSFKCLQMSGIPLEEYTETVWGQGVGEKLL